MIRRFLLAWRIARGFPFNNELELEWNSGDRGWLANVLSSERGKKLWNLLRNEVGSTAVWAVNQKDSVRSCGYAAGVAYIVGLIEACRPQKELPPLAEEDTYFENSMLDQ